MKGVIKIIDKKTGEQKTAVYGANKRGNMQYNVDGKFMPDSIFNRLYDISETRTAVWRVNTVSLFKQIVEEGGPQTSIFRQPLMIMPNILAEVSERAIALNDPELNALMCRLSLYEQSDPYSKEYNATMTNETIDKFYNKQ